MLTITKTCDRCGNSVDNKESIANVWTTIPLHAAWGACRAITHIDLCPSCQDVLLLIINDTRADRRLPRFPLPRVK